MGIENLKARCKRNMGELLFKLAKDCYSAKLEIEESLSIIRSIKDNN